MPKLLFWLFQGWWLVISIVFVIKPSELIETIFVEQIAIWVHEWSIGIHIKSVLVISTTCRISLVILILFVVIWLHKFLWVLLILRSDISWWWSSCARISVWLRQTIMFSWLQLIVLLEPLWVIFLSLKLRLHRTPTAASCTSLIGRLLSGVFISDCANFNLFWLLKSVYWFFTFNLILLYSILLLRDSFATTTCISSTSWLLFDVLF